MWWAIGAIVILFIIISVAHASEVNTFNKEKDEDIKHGRFY
jgi:hypothetical protein